MDQMTTSTCASLSIAFQPEARRARARNGVASRSFRCAGPQRYLASMVSPLNFSDDRGRKDRAIESHVRR